MKSAEALLSCNEINGSSFSMAFLSQLLLHIQTRKISLYAVISLISISLLAYNGGAVFWTNVPISGTLPPRFSPENIAGTSRKVFSVPIREEEFFRAEKLSTHLPLLYKHQNQAISPNRRRVKLQPFEDRVMEFFEANSSNSPCKFRFFMTWISSMESFGSREVLALHSLFKSHPNACLIIASESLDSPNRTKIFSPLSNKGFKVTAISPDYNYLFRDTPAQAWYNQLMRGNLNPGEVPLGQNLSNLLRLGLLYRFGGIYIDTDIIIVKSFGGLKNVIGAQTLDTNTGNWSRLNNAVMVFDEGHPLLYKFIQEFALTFDGNKWGHNGPYLVSRVVSRLDGRPGYDFTVLPPLAFYPVDWSKIGSLFEGPRSLNHSKWILAKLRQIHTSCFAVHLWNKQSRRIAVEKGSIIQHIMFSLGVNSSMETAATVRL